jgi:hypothetical protein
MTKKDVTVFLAMILAEASIQPAWHMAAASHILHRVNHGRMTPPVVRRITAWNYETVQNLPL